MAIYLTCTHMFTVHTWPYRSLRCLFLCPYTYIPVTHSTHHTCPYPCVCPPYLLGIHTCAVPEMLSLPDSDHVTTVPLNVPAAVGAWRVVEGPGWAVDNPSTFSVLLQLPTAGGCRERRLRNVDPPLGRRHVSCGCPCSWLEHKFPLSPVSLTVQASWKPWVGGVQGGTLQT